MIIGVPEEIKKNENRVAITSAGVRTLKNEGHKVLVESGSGEGSGISDEEYTKAGAEIKNTSEEVYETADMIMKIKEPQPEEFNYFNEGQILFTYLHLAAEKEVTKMLLEKGVTSIAYETVEDGEGNLPLLTPMSEVAGRLALQVGARFLEKPQGGAGVLLGGLPGVSSAKVVILGGGVVGKNAAKIAIGFGADVTIVDISTGQLRYLDDIFNNGMNTVKSNRLNIYKEIQDADVVVGAVLIPGAKTPTLVTRDMLKDMQDGSVIVDVAVDQGGCFATTKPTTHQDPVYKVEGINHYCVSNMPGAVPKTSSFALTNETLPYALKIANKGLKDVMNNDPGLMKGLNTFRNKITHKRVAEAHDMDYADPKKLLEQVSFSLK